MASEKRRGSPDLVPNPFIKKRNLQWSLELPVPRGSSGSSQGRISRPRSTRNPVQPSSAGAAAIEAGQAHVDDQLSFFSSLLSASALNPFPVQTPHLPVDVYKSLYTANAGSSHGAHFVVHQHDHPVAGTHYDLRLQINATSSASWAIMYGLPGDPGSSRLNRNATETRVHCLWNHLLETASRETGSLLIWDTGTYQVLPRRSKHDPAVDPESAGEEDEDEDGEEDEDEEKLRFGKTARARSAKTEQEKLHDAFAHRKIRLRLDGTRLPRPYVINLRLSRHEDASGRLRAQRSTAAPRARRHRLRGDGEGGAATRSAAGNALSATGSSNTGSDEREEETSIATAAAAGDDPEFVASTERALPELEDEDEQVRRTNAYAGAINSIGSIHQRRWYLSMDRAASGLATAEWNKKQQQQQDVEEPALAPNEPARLTYPFHVRSPAHERSVVTGRLSADVLLYAGVTGFVSRAGWHPVLH